MTTVTADVDQYVLLAVDIVCSEQGCTVPWNLVAEKVNDFLTGEGIKQHLAKVRKYREQSGRSVPYKTPKGGKGEVAGYNSGIAAPRTPKKKGSDGSETEIVATGKGAGLLWTNPKQRKPKEPTAATEMKQDTKQEVKEYKLTQNKKTTTTEGKTMNTPKMPANKSHKPTAKNERENAITKKKTTGKRGRAKKDDSMEEEDTDDEAYVANGSPSKKQRNLRATYHVNYNEMPDEDEEDMFDARSRKSDEDAAYGSQGSRRSEVAKSQGELIGDSFVCAIVR